LLAHYFIHRNLVTRSTVCNCNGGEEGKDREDRKLEVKVRWADQ